MVYLDPLFFVRPSLRSVHQLRYLMLLRCEAKHHGFSFYHVSLGFPLPGLAPSSSGPFHCDEVDYCLLGYQQLGPPCQRGVLEIADEEVKPGSLHRWLGVAVRVYG